MSNLDALRAQVGDKPEVRMVIRNILRAEGYARHFAEPVPIARAYALETLFTGHRMHVYENDLVLGSMRGLLSDACVPTDAELERADSIVKNYGNRGFSTNADHFAADYETFLTDGVPGTLEKIASSMVLHAHDVDFIKKKSFLSGCEISMRAFGRMLRLYGEAAEEKAAKVTSEHEKEELLTAASICKKLEVCRPETFREALQLVWMSYVAFFYEGRGSMAFGRMDQYLYPFYKKDVASGVLTKEYATELIECTLYKLHEHRVLFDCDQTCNIAIGGVDPASGECSVNELSYILLDAVLHCNVPGPNLSARIASDTPDEFLDKCLQVLGTGLGYPALMNDEVNIPALHRHGYSLYDSRNYCMVGCIENFIQGKQPPWSDGRFNNPKYLEYTFTNGRCMLTGVKSGIPTGDVSEFKTMDEFMAAFERQLEFGAAEYVTRFNNNNNRYNPDVMNDPFLSCFCRCCIERGLDINDGGALYPSVHGACLMGIGIVADSLAAIEDVVFNKKLATLETLRNAMYDNYEHYPELRAKLINAPKYGNNDDFVDKYAVWFVENGEKLFTKYRTRDGGAFYTAIASNTANIRAGRELAASPNGRLAGEPVSDAASPSRGADKKGPTSVVSSISKPDYTLVSCGTVLNQKYSPQTFSDPDKRARLLELIKIYFKKGGQEIQINSVSRDTLKDAMENPENYADLVVRVSGFSAYYTTLSKEVQKDILMRTEH